jgi:hypothetical protein
MTDTHLDSADIELLLDDEHAPAAQPLAAHAARCDQCRTAVEEARFVAEMLTTAPHLKPTRDFSERVMGNVTVSSPWHVAVGQSVRAAVPEQGVARTGLVAGGVLAGIVTTAGAVWVALRADQATMVGSMLLERAQATGLRVANGVAGTVFGPTAVELLQKHGLLAVLVAVPAFLATAGVALAGFHALGAQARLRRG